MRKLIVSFCLLLLIIPVFAQSDDSPYRAAADYSQTHNGGAFLVYEAGELVFEEYHNGYDGVRVHVLASGTKSFSCALAVAAVDDGLLTLDERVSDTLTEWQNDPEREAITIRQILNLTSGLWGADEVLQGRITADKADTSLRVPVMFPPGERFQYGPSSYYIFGEVLRRKLDGEDVVDYLQRRIFDPIGLTNILIVRDRAGNPNLAAGGATTAREWAKFGLLILNDGAWDGEQILSAETLQECFTGTNANPYYGLTLWLQYDPEHLVELEPMALQPPEPGNIPDGVVLGETQPRILIAAGAGKQRLYIVPERDLVVVRLALQDVTFNDAALLALILEANDE
jgi:CubicO group peptidase (beta-lactamase class C family)